MFSLLKSCDKNYDPTTIVFHKKEQKLYESYFHGYIIVLDNIANFGELTDSIKILEDLSGESISKDRIYLTDEKNQARLLFNLGMFESVSHAKGNGHNKEIPKGYSELDVNTWPDISYIDYSKLDFKYKIWGKLKRPMILYRYHQSYSEYYRGQTCQ